MNVLFVISGPSGVGKGTLVKLLMQEDSSLALSVSCTTRAPRKGEQHGREYFFLTKDEFARRRAENDFLECDEHFGNFYGTPKSFVKEQLEHKSVILEIDVAGALQVKQCREEFGKTVLIMIAPPSVKALEERLSKRASETEEEKRARLVRTEYELSKQNEYDYVVVNDNLQDAKRALLEIIENEKTGRKGDKHD